MAKTAESRETAEAPEARFQFISRDLRLEFCGTPEYVNGQVDFFRPALRRALGMPEPAAAPAPAADGSARPAPAPEDSAGRSALDEFMKRVRTRVGRGALQERILLFIYYLTEVKGRNEVGTEDINFCFDLLGLERPRSLANTLGIMKRTQELLDSGSRRGTYCVTEKGREQVQGLLLG
ncbi:MAG: hypothetical protein L6R43_04355 [Planctomycetes bacterium]|nr:hypothetical protein [Planctomycetota bacterium]